MSSGSRGGPPIGRDRDRDLRYGSSSDEFGKRRKNFYGGSTRRDFKSTTSPSGLDNAPQGQYSSRGETPSSNDYGRPRYRGSSLSNSGPLYGGPRPSLYGKDSRYSGSKSSYGYNSKYYSERSGNGAYGSYNASNREPSGEYYGYPSSGRDFRERDTRDTRDTRDHRETWDYKEATSRDMISNSSLPRDLSRDLWRSERPKAPLSASGPSSRKYSSRFNPNNPPATGRSAGQGSGSLSHSGPDYKRDRYDYDNDESYGSRWRSYSRDSRDPREKSRLLSNSRPYSSKEKRSAGLTNSLGNKRGDSYYPSNSTYSNNAPRYQDRYTDRYDRREDGEDSRYDYRGNADDRNDGEDEGFDYGDDSYYREDLREPDEGYRYEDRDTVRAKEHEEESDREPDAKTTDEAEKEDAELEAKKISESVVHDMKTIEALNETVSKPGDPTSRALPTGDDYQPKEGALAGPEPTDTTVKDEAASPSVTFSLPKPKEENPPVDSNTLRSIEKLKLVQVSAEDLDTLDYPDGCMRPLTELDHKLETLKTEFTRAKQFDEDESFLRFSLAKPLANLLDYPFFQQNLHQFSSKFKRIRDLYSRKEHNVKKKRLMLWIKYNTLDKENEKRCAKMEEQLKIIHPPDDESRRELELIDIRAKNNDTSPDAQLPSEPQQQGGRRGRRHGDLVTTEAEFQEILKSLENEQNEDPLSKAKRLSAKIPDLILDPVERQSFIFMDSNNIVHDKEKWASRIKTDFMDNFTEKEHDAFCEAFCRAPKRFGEISRLIGGLRSAEECVVHYYMTKKAVNYKYLVSQFKKRSARKPSRRKSKLKEQEASSNATTDAAPMDATDSGKDTEAVMTPEAGVPAIEPIEEVKRKRGAADDVQTAPEVEIELPPKKKTRRRKGDDVSIPSNPVTEPLPEQHEHEAVANDPSVPQVTTAVYDRPNGSAHEDKRKAITSYWSITEVNDFPRLLAEYGSKWSTIAKKLSSKTATMVRNYYQRNAEKHGWQSIVLDADGRLAQSAGDPRSQISNVDATIVVKPQRRPEEYAPGRRPEDFNGTYESVSHPPKFTDVPVGMFHHPFQATPPKRASVGSLLSGPPPVMYEPPTRVPHLSGVSHSSIPQAVSLPPVLPAPILPPVTHSGVKPSIMSLLNSDSSSLVPSSQYSQPPSTTQEPAPPVAPAPPKPGNLASLLNSSSSPVRPQEAPSKPDIPSEAPRKNSIKSLLHDL